MKIQLLSAMYGRHKAVELALLSWRSEGLEPIMVVSNDMDKNFCNKHRIKWINYPNRPLSMKWNYGVDWLKRNSNADAFLFLGSDDMIEGAENYKTYLFQGYDFIGVSDVYIKELKTNRVKHWQGYKCHRVGEPGGAGRCLSRKLMDALEWKLWVGSKDNGLDGVLWNRITALKPKCAILSSDKIKITDLKDEHSLTPFARFNLPIIE